MFRFPHLGLGSVPDPAVVENFRIFRIELDHLIQVADGVVIVTFGGVPGGADVFQCRNGDCSTD
jgi:hypothetical protein